VGRKGKGLPNGERGPCVNEKKGGKKRKGAKSPFWRRGVPTEGTVSRWKGGCSTSPTRKPVKPDPPGPTVDEDVDHVLYLKTFE